MAATRHSGLECLRIISIILIVSMHILGNTFHTSNWLNKEFILFINTLGNTGVTLFILISGYFGIRFNTHKFFKMLVVVWFYSIVSYLIESDRNNMASHSAYLDRAGLLIATDT